ncbi:hypothetical protein CMQ_3771 [Grosmannia clavigera kw1407]|uniref:Fibroin-3 related protein n=1 Tax=Grosmannia clavigera (strain kw1407 / UAMH 11150) TaxID=655863 RepID=F0X9G2_GROCL|nr:uncharacterized protein CMQ_3771 [Grosmannia clavigera kw1407]EFX05702.1 hypothetical protein CMQ_3771 [Grosmannia clavigera kw1407]
MAPIDVAMARSLHHRSVLDVLAAAVYPVVSRRDSISDVKTAFSSWDNCMATTYCKWPVIAVIIIAGLIIVTGYRAEEPMMTGAAPKSRAPVKDVPQFATFEVTKSEPVDEDALPAMPSWEGANHTKVLMEEDSVELTDLKKPAPAGQSVSPVNGFRGSPGVVSPGPGGGANPYGAYGRPLAANNLGGSHAAVANGYMAAGAIPRSTGPGDQAYGQNSQGYNQSNPEYGQNIQGYNQSNPDYSQGNQGYYQGNQGNPGYGQNGLGYGQNNLNNRGYNNADISRQYSASDYGDTGFDQQTMISRHQTPVQSPLGYRGPSPGPQQAYARNMQGNAPGNMGAMGNMPGNGGYDSFGRNATSSPEPLGYDNLDRRTPHIPDMGLSYGAPVSPVAATGMEPTELYGGPSSRSPPNGFNDPGPIGLGGLGGPNGRSLDSRSPPVQTYAPATSTNNYGGAMNSNQAEVYEMPSSPPSKNKTGDFDFGPAYSRPEAQVQDPYNTRSNGYNTNVSSDEIHGYTNTASPPPLMQPQPRQAAYPGYRPYQQ